MLTVADCREVLGADAPESDADDEAIRDLGYFIAEAAIDIAAKEAAEARSGKKEV